MYVVIAITVVGTLHTLHNACPAPASYHAIDTFYLYSQDRRTQDP